MNTNARHLNQIAQTHERVQCPKGHWTSVRLVLSRDLRTQVRASETEACSNPKCKETI